MSDADSYLRKLQLVEGETKRLDAITKPPGQRGDGELKSTEEAIQLLTAISIYLTFVRSGAIPCQEDGGHHRPSHHASVANSIFSILLRIINTMRSDSSVRQKSSIDLFEGFRIFRFLEVVMGKRLFCSSDVFSLFSLHFPKASLAQSLSPV